MTVKTLMEWPTLSRSAITALGITIFVEKTVPSWITWSAIQVHRHLILNANFVETLRFHWMSFAIMEGTFRSARTALLEESLQTGLVQAEALLLGIAGTAEMGL